MAARVAQCFYNSMKAKGRWSILSSSLGPRYGDSLLFALATSQVMPPITDASREISIQLIRHASS